MFVGHNPQTPPLFVLDVVARPLWPDFCTDVVARLRELGRACTAAVMAVFAPPNLVELFERAVRAGWRPHHSVPCSCGRRRTGSTLSALWPSPPAW